MSKTGLGKGIVALLQTPPDLYAQAATEVAQEHRARLALIRQGIAKDDPALTQLVKEVLARVSDH